MENTGFKIIQGKAHVRRGKLEVGSWAWLASWRLPCAE